LTEAEWLAATEPATMLEFMQSICALSERKARRRSRPGLRSSSGRQGEVRLPVVLICNELGCGFLVLAGGAGFLMRWIASWIWPNSTFVDAVVLAMASVIGISADIGYRASQSRETGVTRWFVPSAGGSLWAFPFWFWALATLVFAGFDLFK
jgi:hypothetical protein